MKGFVTLFKQTLVTLFQTFEKVNTAEFPPNCFPNNQKILFMRSIYTPPVARREKNFATSFKIFSILLLLLVGFYSNGQITKRIGEIITAGPSTCTAGPCTPAGTIVIDGNPCDWSSGNFSGFPIRSYQLDAFGNVGRIGPGCSKLLLNDTKTVDLPNDALARRHFFAGNEKKMVGLKEVRVYLRTLGFHG